MTRKKSTPKKPQVSTTEVPVEDVQEEEVNVNELLEANAAFAKQNEALAKELEELKRKNVAPATIRRTDDLGNHQVGQDGVRKFEDDELVKIETRTLDDPAFMTKLATEKFMEELVHVRIQETSEEQADIGFVISVNNKQCVFRRGEEKIVPRYFVEGLARAKRTGFKNVLKVDPMTGEQEYVYPAHTGLRYPFEIIEDKNPNGREWLKAVLRQP